ncbi:MAG: biotin/lipoyl-binding protein [Deltaproteobacteria bacterium]|nr:biotin/lipoyl-binding protein [Deltaproteobacteria bacterium]
MSERLRRIAVVNRGEAATRCLRAIRELRAEEGSDLVGIALYTDPDRFAPFVREADEVISLGAALRGPAGGPLRPAYLDHERVLAALRATRADAVWPGWGFLAEDPSFVEKLEAAGLVFLGPAADTMRMLGDKIESKRIAESAGVPVTAWSGGPVALDDLRSHADTIGLPLMLKATAGGGGRGIRRIDSVDQLEAAFESATQEAANAFGDGTLFLEACITAARHIEVQIAADAHGGVLALGLRDCSVQRKHQKVVEEGPPPGMSAGLADEIREASVRMIRKAGYVGVATCEYLLTDDGRFFFLEVNPRLQVEHGVTELLTDFDLVKAQIHIARGGRLPDEVPEQRGHAIEVRVCAEDPAENFAPSPGRIALLELPAGPGIRVDSGVAPGGEIPSEFDSMVAKVIAYGATRDEARSRLVRAVSDMDVVIERGTVNKGFLLDILDHPDFRAGRCHTAWLEEAGIASRPEPVVEALVVAATLTYQREREAVRMNFFAEAARGRPQNVPPSTGRAIDLVYAGASYRLVVYAVGGWSYRVHLGSRVAQVRVLELGPHRRQLIIDDQRHAVLFSESDVEIRLEIDGRFHRVERDVGGKVRAPAPALVIEVGVKAGDAVRAGDRLGLLEAMKTETAFFASVSGTVREVLVRGGERVSAGDVIVVIEPSVEGGRDETAAVEPLELPAREDPLDVFFDEKTGLPDLRRAAGSSTVGRAAAIGTLRSETRRILMGYDVNPERADRLVALFEARVADVAPELVSELAQIATAVEIVADIEALFSRTPSRIDGEEEFGPSNDVRMAMYLRRIGAEGAGIDSEFLDQLRRVLALYEITSLEPTAALERAVLRLSATRTTLDLRHRLVMALLQLLLRLGTESEVFERYAELADALERLALLRGTVPPGVADLAAHARFVLFERPRRAEVSRAAERPEVDLALTVVPPPDGTDLEEIAARMGVTPEEARRIELWRLEQFDLERVETFEGVFAFHGRARDQSGDERLFCFAEIDDLGPDIPGNPDRSIFDERFHEAIEALRSLQGSRDPTHRLHWNRLYVTLRPPIVLTGELVSDTIRRLAPETGHLGLERVVVRAATVPAERLDAEPRLIEIMTGNPSGGRVESAARVPHREPLAPATVYERRTAAARARGLIYPYEIVRIFTAEPSEVEPRPSIRLAAGTFEEHDLQDGRAVAVDRPAGRNTCAIVFGIITTPTAKFPEGMRRVLILGDPSFGMGALAEPECARIVSAIDLAEREELPVEWVAVSSGARIAMDSGTENLDATARVVRRIVTFTDEGGEINVIVAGVNVGAQSYFDALATMGLQSRGVLIMLSNSSSMVLTGRAALEISGGVSAEDDMGIGGYERIMAPSGQAQFQARNIGDAYRILLQHYAATYRAPGEDAPRRFETSDERDRDLTTESYEGEEDFRTVGEVFSDETNPGRKRPFAMRPIMRALIDQDAGFLERWRDWVGAETAIVWDTHLGGWPITLIAVESRPVPRNGHVPSDGPDAWTAGTLFPLSSKKVARALNASSGVRPVVILANLSGFDGSPESMRRGVLELGAEIARAVVRFEGPLLFTVVSRYHGGAYVVFSSELNPEMHASALTGSYASVIGGAAAAAVVFPREVRRRANSDPRVTEARGRVAEASDSDTRIARRAELDRVLGEVLLERQAEVAAEFDSVHTVERARDVGSLQELVEPRALRPSLIALLERGSS